MFAKQMSYKQGGRHWQIDPKYTLIRVVAAEIFVQKDFHILSQDWAFIFSLSAVEKNAPLVLCLQHLHSFLMKKAKETDFKSAFFPLLNDPYHQLIVTISGLINKMEKCAGYIELGHLQCVF